MSTGSTGGNGSGASQGRRDIYKYLVLGTLFSGWILSYFDRMVISVALTSIGEDFGLSAAELGIVLSSFFVGYALMQIPGGWLADRFGSKRLMIVAITLWSAFTALTGAAWSLASMLVIRFFFGLGEGAWPGASTKAVAEYFPKEQRARATSTMLSSNALGVAIAPLVAAPAIVLLGWRAMFVVAAVLGLVVAVLVWRFVRAEYLPKAPGQEEDATSSESALESEVRGQEGQEDIVDGRRVENIKDLMKTPTIWLLVVAWFGLDIMAWGFVSWLPTYMQDARGLELVSAGFYASLPFFAGTVAMISGGWIIDKFFVGLEKFVVAVSMALAAMFMYLMHGAASSLGMTVTYQVLCALFMYLGFAAIWVLPVKIFPTGVVGSAAGIMNFGGQAAGILSPAVVGFLVTASSGSYDYAIYFLMSGAILAMITALMVRRTGNIAGRGAAEAA